MIAMCVRLRAVLLLGACALILNGAATAGEKKDRDIFDYDAQKAADGFKRIVFIADTRDHGPRGNHEFVAASVFLARALNAHDPKCWAVVTTLQKMKKQPFDLKHADAVVVLMNDADPAANSKEIKEAMDKGAGFMAIHYGVEVSKGKQGDNFLKWMGGYFEREWSVNPFWTPEFKDIPKHETTRGVKPFSINDEWYYHMRFVDGMKGVTPVLSAVAPVETVTSRWKGGKPSSHAGNPGVLADVQAGKPQAVAWAYDRPDGGRGFGFTGLHKHSNLANDSMRTLLTNAVAWVAKIPVPENGIQTKALSRDDLETLIDDGRLAVKNRGI
jgi:hypothetical protein